MNDWFIWKGVKSTDVGLHVSTYPPITIPQERINFIDDVYGRSGSIPMPEGDDVYNEISLPFSCFIESEQNINSVITYLKGHGTLQYPTRSGGYYNAYIDNQIPFEKILRDNPYRMFSINFRCYDPFFYDLTNTPIVITSNNQTITNPGNVFAEPRVEINGSGSFTISIGQSASTLRRMSFQNVPVGGIAIVPGVMDATSPDGSSNLNNCVLDDISDDFFILYPGLSTISWSLGGGDNSDSSLTNAVNSITITPNWRRL